MEEKDEKRLLRIDLVGKDENLFANLKGKLIKMVDKVLDSSLDVNSDLTVKEELQKFTSLGLNFAESKLKKASIENDHIITEIQEKLSIIQKNKAEARKINATARTIEFDQNLKELTFTLKMTNALILGEGNEEALAFTKQIDVFLEVIKSINEMNSIK
ncbi:hypothetical protein [Pseudotamlana agarivorans]|uniref:hypothetical protein n=1 Tax=Pseudotamlana agarivorans TaxID=481183 RepID=UPI000837186A|nr:hypothetical protein [Tamlana agarivorans]